MAHVGGQLQAQFMARIRGRDPERCLVVPVDVGKSAAMALVADHYGEMVAAPFEFALTETGFAVLAGSIARAEAARSAEVVRVGVESAGHRRSSFEPSAGTLVARMDDGRLQPFGPHETGADRLAHAYGVTAHRSQGATVEATHAFEDGGGRELAYVKMSRARGESRVYAVADSVGQAAEDLSRDWSAERRQLWAIDSGTPARQAAEVEAVALGLDGRARSWGWNGLGQLGDGSTADHIEPVLTSDLSGATGVAAGVFHTLAQSP